jgi:ECF transporter S component (folate family)
LPNGRKPQFEIEVAVCVLHPASYGKKENKFFGIFFPAIWCEERRYFFKMRKKSSIFPSVKTVVLAAMLAAMSVVIGIFCKSFLNFGNGLLRITFENLPIVMSGLLFGPVIGGVIGLVTDLVSYFLTAQGYPPNWIVTIGAITVGVVSGLVSHCFVRKRGTLQIILSASLAHLIGSMIIKPIGLYQFYGYAVLIRIPLYVGIAFLEIFLLCQLFRRKSFCSFIERL